MRLVGGAEKQNGLVLYPRCGKLESGEITQLWKSLQRSEGSQPHTESPNPGLQFQEEKSP